MLTAGKGPTVTLVVVFITAVGVKSNRSTLTVDPPFAVDERGTALALWKKMVSLTCDMPAESVTQTNPPTEVADVSVMVPENTPLASMEPVPTGPEVGATTFCGLNLIVQVVQLAVNPPPVTVTVAPRAADEGVKFTKPVIV